VSVINRKSHTRFRLIQKSVTLNDLEQRQARRRTLTNCAVIAELVHFDQYTARKKAITAQLPPMLSVSPSNCMYIKAQLYSLRGCVPVTGNDDETLYISCWRVHQRSNGYCTTVNRRSRRER